MNNAHDKIEAMVADVLEVISLELGLSELPEVIKAAPLAVFNCFNVEVISYIVFYSHHYEKSKNGVDRPKVYKEWCEITGSTISRKHCGEIINKYFNRYILSKEKARHRMLDKGGSAIGSKGAWKKFKG